MVPGTPITDALGITEDIAYEFDALPNRPDTLSIMGVARDLAAHQRVAFERPSVPSDTRGSDAAGMCSLTIHAPDLCGRFLARVVSGVALGASPRWMAQRLLAAGMRPINNVVDVSNYVMLELGQPNHAYDLAKLPDGAIGVRWARDGETIRTLDDVERTLCADDGVIVDANDSAIGIAGVMGGASTEISAATSEVLFEAAWWDPAAVAATSARLNLHSEASLRFKRGADPEIAPIAAQRFAQLLGEIVGSQLHPGVIDVEGDRPARVVVQVRPARVNALLGTALSSEEMALLIEPIGYGCESAGDELLVTVPTWRPDSTIEVDVIEEIGRHFGFSNIERSVPVSPRTGALSPRQRDRRTLRRALIGAGLSEAMPMPFLAPGDLERCGLDADGLVLANPLAAEESILRTSLLPGLLKAVAYNERHRMSGVRLFEMGRVFAIGDRGVLTDVDRVRSWPDRVLSGEKEHLAAVLAGSRKRPAAVELVELLLRRSAAGTTPWSTVTRWPAADLGARPLPAGLHPGRSRRGAGPWRRWWVRWARSTLRVLAAHDITERAGWVQLDLSTRWSGLPSEGRWPGPCHGSRRPTSTWPSSWTMGSLRQNCTEPCSLRPATSHRSASSSSTSSARNSSAGRKSLAFRVRFQELDRTLTDAEVAGARSAMIQAAAETHGAELRG